MTSPNKLEANPESIEKRDGENANDGGVGNGPESEDKKEKGTENVAERDKDHGAEGGDEKREGKKNDIENGIGSEDHGVNSKETTGQFGGKVEEKSGGGENGESGKVMDEENKG